MKRSKRPAGFILYEAIMAVALSLTLVVGIAQLLNMVAQQRRLARQYAVAVQEAGNLMEDVVSRSWDGTTAEQLASVTLSQACEACLPDAELTVDVADEGDDVRRIRVRIEWRCAAGRREPVGLVGWKHRHEENDR